MPKKDRSARDRIAGEISAEMSGLVRHFRRGFASCADQLDLAQGEAQALWLLREGDGISTTELARRLEVDPANVSTMLTKLERRKLVRRSTATRDRRKRLVSLTAQGRKAKDSLAGCMEQRQPGFAALTTGELATFRDLLRRVRGES